MPLNEQDFDLMRLVNGCWEFVRGFGDWSLETLRQIDDETLAKIGIVCVSVLTPRKQ